MAVSTLTESKDYRAGNPMVVQALITIGDDDTETTETYNGIVVGIDLLYGSTVPDADWDLYVYDALGTDLTAGNGEALVGSATDYRTLKHKYFGISDLKGGVPVHGKITFGEVGMGTASSTVTATVYILRTPA